MAKSLRSKRERKLRAVKRERYGKKELERLKTMLAKAEGSEDNEVKFVTVASLKNRVKSCDNDISDEDLEPMEVNAGKKQDSKYDNIYPVWLSKRKIKKMKQQKQSTKQKKIKKAKQKAKRKH